MRRGPNQSCVADPTNHGDFTDAHCDTTAVPTETGAFKHVSIPEGVETAVEGTNAKTKNSTTEATIPVLEATVGGIATKLEATTVSASGTLTNQETGGVMEAVGSGIVITYTGVTVAAPANCTVHSPGQAAGTVKTATLKSVPVAGTPMKVKFEPVTPTEFTKLEFAGGSCAINGVNPTVNGTVLTEPSGQMTNGSVSSTGATLIVNVTKASAQLKVGGQNASLIATETIKMEGGNPIGSTE